jgi:hypothetical protein
MNDNNGLEFETGTMDGPQPQNDPASLKDKQDLNDLSRQSFRLPIQKIGTIKIAIADQTLNLVNIVVNDRIGIGVRVFRDDIFAREQEIPSIRFKLFGQDFNFQGRVQHISPDVAGHYLCGIMLTQLTDEQKSILKNSVQKLYTELFC